MSDDNEGEFEARYWHKSDVGWNTKFSLGEIVATPGAMVAFAGTREAFSTFLDRHVSGDWGDMSDADKRANDEAIVDGGRIFSAYTLKDGIRIWIITEAVGDNGRRASTCVLLPEEY